MSSSGVGGVKKIKNGLLDKVTFFSHLLVVYTLIFLLLYGGVLYISLGKNQLHNVAAVSLAKEIVKYNFYSKDKVFNYYDAAGRKKPFNIYRYNRVQVLQKSLKNYTDFNQYYFYILLGLAGFFTGIINWVLARYKTDSKDDVFVRGSRLVDEKTLIKELKKEGDLSGIKLANVPLPKNYYKKNMGLYGDTGVGKSQQLLALLTSIRDKDKKVLILDKSGEFIQHLYDEKKDVILSPFDERTHNWTPFCEGVELFDFERLSRSFIPTSTGQKDDHWPEASVTVLTWLLYKMHKAGLSVDVDEIFEKLLESRSEVQVDELGREHIVKVRGINELLKGTLAELVIDPDSPDHAASVIASIIPKIRSLWYLRGLNDKPVFSFRDWAQNEDDKRWVFIKASEDELDAVSPLVSAWLDTVIKTVISLDKSSERDIKIVIDELQSLSKINTLVKGVTEVRKYGCQLILGFTSTNALYDIYGQHLAQAMLSSLPIKLIYRTSEPSAAKWNAGVLGEAEKIISRKTKAQGEGRGDSETETKDKDYIVSPTEMQNLPDLSAYLKLGGEYPACLLKYDYVDYPIINTRSITRTIPDGEIISKLDESTINPVDSNEPLI